MVLSVLPDLNSQGDDVKFLGILKNDGDGHSAAGGPSKTCSDGHNEFRVSGDKQERRPMIPLGLGILEG